MELMENPNYKFRISCSPNPVGEHRHRHLELAYIAKGTILHNINGRTERIDEGNYFIIDHRTYHSYEKVSDKPLFVVNLIFYPEFLDRTLVGKYRFDDLLNCFLLKFSYKSLKSPVTNMTFSDKNGQVQAIVEDILQEYQTENYGYMEYIRCQLVRIFIIAMRQVGKNDELPDYNKTVTEIINIIDKRYSEKLRLSDVAKQLGYSTEYLSTLFSKTVGMSFSEHLMKIRIEQACKLLETTDTEVYQISAMVGYNDIKFFNKVFKKNLGCTPTEFRKMYI